MKKYLSCFIAIIIVFSTISGTTFASTTNPQYKEADLLDDYVYDTWPGVNSIAEADSSDDYAYDTWPGENSIAEADSSDDYVKDMWQDENYIAEADAYVEDIWQDENIAEANAYIEDIWQDENYIAEANYSDDVNVDDFSGDKSVKAYLDAAETDVAYRQSLEIAEAAATLTISPSTDWNNISASGATRTVTVTTNLPTYTVNRPSWFNTTEFVTGGFKLIVPANNTGSVRTGTVNVIGDGITRSFDVSQNANSPTLTISPSTNWTNISASGGTRTHTVTTNQPTYGVRRPSWFNATEFPAAGQFKLICPANSGAERTGTVTVYGPDDIITRSFTVTQLAGSPTLTISPSTDWNNISASGGTRSHTVTTNLPSYGVRRPSWFNATEFPAAGQFKLICPANSGAERTGTVTVYGTDDIITRSFTVTQLAGSPTLTISPSTDWTNISASGGAVRDVTVSTNLPTYWLWKPSWINNEWIGGNARLTVTANNGAARSGTVKITQNEDGSGLSRSFTVSQLANSTSPYATISPSTDWNNISASGGTRTHTITTNLPSYRVQRPTWFESTTFPAAGQFQVNCPANSGAARTGTVKIVGAEGDDTVYASFSVSQLANTTSPYATISPSTDWTNISASGGARTHTITTNLSSYRVQRPAWFEPTTFPAAGQFQVNCPANNTAASRSGTIKIVGAEGDDTVYASFSVSQLAGSISAQYSATIKNYYDDGYVVKNGSSSNIVVYQNEVKRIFNDLCGLQITVQNPQLYRTPADIWKGTVNSGNIDLLHQVEYPNAETDRPKLITAAKNSFTGDSTTTIAIWSGNGTLSMTAGKSYLNRSCSSGTHIFMLARDADNEKTGVFVHEMAHQYGAKDHYHEDLGGGECVGGIYCSTCGTSPRPSWCMMVNSRPANISQKAAGELFCSGCTVDVKNHVNSHH